MQQAFDVLLPRAAALRRRVTDPLPANSRPMPWVGNKRSRSGQDGIAVALAVRARRMGQRPD
jgi:hypothetical protein